MVRRFFILCFLGVFLVATELHAQDNASTSKQLTDVHLCEGYSATLQCLKEHLWALQNSKQFWNIVGMLETKAKECNSPKATADFLSLASIDKGADFDEYFAESVENLCLASPACLKTGKKLLDSSEQQKLDDYLKFPTFHETGELKRAGCH